MDVAAPGVDDLVEQEPDVRDAVHVDPPRDRDLLAVPHGTDLHRQGPQAADRHAYPLVPSTHSPTQTVDAGSAVVPGRIKIW
ncbi:hypothetical protein GCM10027517_24580 [Phycicoccus ginsengisoli]